MSGLPLLRPARADALIAYRNGQFIDVQRFLSDVATLSAALPDRSYILNVCADRYAFLVGFAGALSRGQITMLLPNQTPVLIQQIAALYPDLYCLTDGEPPLPSLETITYGEPTARSAAFSCDLAFPAEQVAALAFTSGSTGQPAPHVKTWRSLVAGTTAFGARYDMRGLRGGAVLATVAQQHIFGFETTIMLPLQHGLMLHSGRPFYPGDISAELQNLPRPRVLVTTPIHLRALLADGADLPAADFLLCATAPLAANLAAEAEARFSAPLWEIYGCAEAGQLATRQTTKTGLWTPLDGVRLRQDASGTWVKGGHVETDVLLGDVIEVVGGGRFRLHGRTSDLVNIAGKRTSLSHLNYHLNAIKGVVDGVFIMPEEDTSAAVTRLMAFVVAPELTADAILKALRPRIDPVFLPRPLHLVRELPRNSTGKLPLEAIRHLVAEFAER